MENQGLGKRYAYFEQTQYITSVRRNSMKSSIRDKSEGTLHEVKGKVKEVAGKLSDSPKLEAEGTVEKNAGKVQKKIGQVKKVFGK